jgi:hypothetical protein
VLLVGFRKIVEKNGFTFFLVRCRSSRVSSCLAASLGLHILRAHQRSMGLFVQARKLFSFSIDFVSTRMLQRTVFS